MFSIMETSVELLSIGRIGIMGERRTDNFFRCGWLAVFFTSQKVRMCAESPSAAKTSSTITAIVKKIRGVEFSIRRHT